MITWQDGSSYSRNDKEKIPNVWKTNAGSLKIVVVYNHVIYPDQWVFSCEPFFEHEELGDIDQLEAKMIAVRLVQTALRNTLEEFRY